MVFKEKKITVELSKKQLRELLLDVLIGSFIRGGVLDQQGKTWTHIEETKDFLLREAENAGHQNLVQRFEGHLLPSDKIIEEYEEIIEEHNDDEFWHELTTRLGQRDFKRAMTEEDRAYLKENKGFLPEKIHGFYEKYEEEFDQRGVDRLAIQD